MRSADCDSQDKNFVGSLDWFAKRAGLHDWVDSILTHVAPIFPRYPGIVGNRPKPLLVECPADTVLVEKCQM